ncbi:receptor-like protein kinase FERONIA [Cannabis sativa]|uniref:receptor-like protein kinase FERONIA n=1 Tax=Cannabis sativa TaxID=3483 RepID=UPI0029CA52B5|nr:receptor-like protein kinase FERONIA [Cannabis sativa]
MIPKSFQPLVIFLVLITVVFARGQPLQANYIHVEDTSIDCGSDAINKTARDDRKWSGDINSKLFPLKFDKNSDSFASPVDRSNPPDGTDPVPYGTARLSFTEFTYTIPVTPGPKFVRLHFYSATYRNVSISKAFFSVKVNDQYTLLNNFSVSLNADFFSRKDIVKEYYVNVESSKSTMSIKFIPSTSISGAIAVINGIEVVSLPAGLYNTEHGLRTLGDTQFSPLNSNIAMETMYRIDIGSSRSIPPREDTGFFRNWDNEDPYLTKRGSSLIPADTSAVLNFEMVPNYTAPKAVYQTARTMGNKDKEIVRSYNLTWEYPVDNGFNYMVRLHFCEIVLQMNSSGDRVFSIFIADQTAETDFDVIKLAGGKFVPYVTDYLVSMFNSSTETPINLSIALQASQLDSQSLYNDGILNGVEIFKMGSKNNLAGPNPKAKPKWSPNNLFTKENGKKTRLVAGIISGVVSVVIILSLLAFFVVRRGRKIKDSASSKGIRWAPKSFATTKSSKAGGSSSLPSDRCRDFSLVEIIAATNNFEGIFIIGVGGFGNVYKGYIDNGTIPVAIKRLKTESSQGIQEFKNEIELLSHLRHRHLVSLIGYCNEDPEMILVYDYMSNGTLRDHLYKTDNPPLTWTQRLQICMGAANGLHYLHTGTKYTIIHRDVKTTNILLDENWVAKVSDFGLSKTGPTSMSNAHLTTVVKGSIGYLDPEYYRRQQLTEKSDVYSFGVVLCEVLCGRPPILRTAQKGQVSLVEWVQNSYQNETLHEIMDPYLTGKIAPECLKKYGELIMQCMLDNGTERPSMKDIVWRLEFALQLQNYWEANNYDSVDGGELKTKAAEDEVTLLKTYGNKIDIGDDDGTFTSSWAETTESKSSASTKLISSSSDDDSRKRMSGTVFSEITDYPKGR